MRKSLSLAAAVLLAVAASAPPQGADAQYVQVYDLIKEADTLRANEQFRQALDKYKQAQDELKRIQAANPGWNEKAVKYRLNYLEEKLAGLGAKATVAAGNTNVVAAPVRGAEVTGPERQIKELEEQLRQVATDRVVLEAKLREALSAQPAAVDPRELVKAEGRIKTLEKENELLKANLHQEQTKAGRLIDPALVEQKEKALTEASARLKQDAETMAALAGEKRELQTRLQELKNAAPALQAENQTLKQQVARLQEEQKKSKNKVDAAELERAQKALNDSTRELRQQSEATAALTREKQALQGRLQALSEGEIKTLRAENEKLKKDLADSKRQAEKAETSRADAKRIQQLEQERDALQKKLTEAAAKRSNQKQRSAQDDPSTQLIALNARIAALEAQKAPYTPEELALFKAPEQSSKDRPSSDAKSGVATGAASAKPAKTSVRDLPPGAGALVAEAQRAFAARRYDEAERKYQQVLAMDEKNVFTLANLAAIQMEQSHLAEAETNLKRALGEAPDDAYSLSLFGILKFRQEKFDEALDALSRAAKLDPQNAEAQNYLGITLSQKGLRPAAEAALRKAVQLAPGYGSAHYNLAVVYATQKPQFIELARLHYQKALSAGHPKNADLEKALNTNKAAANPP